MNGKTTTMPEVPVNEKNRVFNLLRNKATLVKMGASTAIMAGAASFPSFAADVPAGAGISIDFDVTEMFKFANIIISSLMPVVYITAGLGIGFLIINSLKNAFR